MKDIQKKTAESSAGCTTPAETTTTTPMSCDSQQQSVPQRDAQGRFVKGSSGNYAGRPKGKKNELTELKQDLEIAVRKNLTSNKISSIVDAMIQKALEGNVGAAKVILDKVVSNAKEIEDAQESGGGLKIVIENATLDVLQQNNKVIDLTAEEIKTHEQSE